MPDYETPHEAATAATAESLRWGGADKRPAEEPERFW